jgi:hypothetical protein
MKQITIPSRLQKQYIELNTKWQLTRELEGYLENGKMRLSNEREGEFATPLSDLWYQMTNKEQDELEEMLVAIPEAPVDLGLVDTVPQSGQMPRRPRPDALPAHPASGNYAGARARE